VHDHLVEFYESDPLLVASVCDFVSPALEAGDPMIVVATNDHRRRFIEAVEAQGIDVESARRQGRFVELDAAETLAMFMAGSFPDPFRFDEVVGGLVRSTGQGSPGLRIYGEMVALLWEQGNRSAALRLETLWNGLSESHAFTLLCAYPLSSINLGPDTAPFRGICSTHSGVRLRFDVPQTDEPAPEYPPSASQVDPDDIAMLKDLGSELNALNEAIRNATQMGQLPDSSSISR
jgi:hypothetical protein